MGKENIRYVYPKLPAVKDYGIFRVGGSGLANCLFIYARAIVASKKYGAKIISPTWFNLSIGPYLRGQQDKRHYSDIFKKESVSGLKKLYFLFLKRDVLTVQGLGGYFSDLTHQSSIIRKHFLAHLSEDLINSLPVISRNSVAVHIRLGDYIAERRVPIEWYIQTIKTVNEYFNYETDILIFSDGTEDELQDVLSVANTRRAFYGSAFADIWAISQCSLVIASDSTFSAWGAFLNQVPLIFYKRHFPPVLDKPDHEIVIGEDVEKISPFLAKLFIGSKMGKQ